MKTLVQEKAEYEKLLARVDKLIGEVEKMLEDLEEILAETLAFITHIKGVVDENSAKELRAKNIEFVIHEDEGGF